MRYVEKNTYYTDKSIVVKNISDFTKNISLRLLKSYLGVQVEVLQNDPNITFSVTRAI